MADQRPDHGPSVPKVYMDSMSTTVRIDEADRDRRFQVQLKEPTGQDMPLQELLDLIRHGCEDLGHLLDSLWQPPGKAAREAWGAVQATMDGPSDPFDIDRHLDGEDG